MQNSELFRFTSRCLSLNTQPVIVDKVRDAFASGSVDIDHLIHFASNNFVLPAVWRRLEDAGLGELFPKEYSYHLKEVVQLNENRNNEILKQVAEISEVLFRAGIEPIYLKGTGNLLDGLYPSIADRMIGDIDFLVSLQDYEKSISIMQTINYSSDVKLYPNELSWYHHPRMFKPKVPADVEIHNALTEFRYENNFKADKIIKDCISTNYLVGYVVPTTANRIIHTFIHSQLGNRGHRYYIPGLRDLYDAWLLSQQVNWREVLEQIEEKEKARVFFEYMEYLFCQEQDLSQIKNKATLKYIRRHRWFMDHPRWHRLYIGSHKLYELLVIRYIKRIVRALFSKKDLLYIYRRLKDPAWYGKHFKRLRKQIFGKK